MPYRRFGYGLAAYSSCGLGLMRKCPRSLARAGLGPKANRGPVPAVDRDNAATLAAARAAVASGRGEGRRTGPTLPWL